MSIKNNKNAIELLSLILSLMDDDDRAELRAAMDEGEESKDEPTLCDECPDRDTCPDSPLRLNNDDEWDDEDDEDTDDEPDDDDDAPTIEITIPDGMPCIVMGGTDDELPLAIELIKEMGLVSPAPAPAKEPAEGSAAWLDKYHY